MNYAYFKKLIGDLFFPPRCHICGDVCEISRHGLCNNCAAKKTLLHSDDLCVVCGKWPSSCVCGDEPFAFSRCISAMEYDHTLVTAIDTLKKHPKSFIARDFALQMTEMLEKQMPDSSFDFVTCVPMQQSKIAQRGHNQAETLARCISTLIDVPFLVPTLIRVEESQTQHKLSAALRVKNARASFRALEASVEGKILLIDDVATTLSTLNQCAQLLKDQGASDVVCLTVATTALHPII